MSSGLIYYDTDQLREIAEQMGAMSKQVKLSLYRANSRTTKAARKRILQCVREVAGVTQAKFRKRIFFRVDHRRGGYIWVGLNPIGLHWLNPRQLKRGVRARGGQNRPGAFIVRPGSSISGLVFKRRGKGRLPIEKQEVEIEQALKREIDRALFAGDWLEEFFLKEFTRDLEWRVKKA